MGVLSELTFGLKDVLAIITFTGSAAGLYYSNKAQVKKALEKAELCKTENSEFKKSVDAQFEKKEQDLKEKVQHIYNRITEVRDEQKEAHSKVSSKLDEVSTTLLKMSGNISEMSGYLRAKKENED